MSHPVTGWPVTGVTTHTNNNNNSNSTYLSPKNTNNNINRIINLLVFYYNKQRLLGTL